MSKKCSCRFLYGAETSQQEMEKIEDALETQTELKTEILFYRKTGESKPAYVALSSTRTLKGQREDSESLYLNQGQTSLIVLMSAKIKSPLKMPGSRW